MHKLVERVLRHIRKRRLVKAGDRLGIAVSGGPDSVALLRLMLELREELGVVLGVVHFNHKIRGAEADADQQFVGELARHHALDLHAESADTPAFAKQHKLSLEDAARRLRYEYFRSLLSAEMLNKIATAHSMDDQAETVLMRMIRGTGTRGLAGILERVAVAGEAGSDAAVIRPLLRFRRKELLEFVYRLRQDWREDSSNLDLRHTRNRVRRVLIPLLEKEFNPSISERLAELAEIACAEEEYWQKQTEAARGVPVSEKRPASDTLDIQHLLIQPLALRRRMVRTVAEQLGLRLEFQLVEAILKLARAAKSGEKTLTVNETWRVVRQGNKLCFEQSGAEQPVSGYEYSLEVPGEVEVPELGSRFRASLKASSVPTNGKDPDKPNAAVSLTIRNWRAGDRYQPDHCKAPKKIKELLQSKHLPRSERHLWPVIVCGETIVWVRGFASSNPATPPMGPQDVVIEEFSIQNGERRRK